MKTMAFFFPVKAVSLAIGLVAILLFLYDIGYEDNSALNLHIPLAYFVLLTTFITLDAIKLVVFSESASRRSRTALLLVLIVILLYLLLPAVFQSKPLEVTLAKHLPLLRLCIVFLFIIEYSIVIERFYALKLQPAFIFAISFALLIGIGTLLLKLPLAAHREVSLIDAFFTATSAVCVTGLVVLDTGSDFTRIGQIIIMLLFQAGGLGMLTLTSFFAYFFKENLSYRESIFVRDFISSNQLSNIFRLTAGIVGFTLGIELLGAIFIYFYIPEDVIPVVSERIFFSVFHAISAFCNAGFSTLKNSLYDISFRFNYPVHLIIAFLFIFGGLGYNIMFNMLEYVREKILSLVKKNILLRRNFRSRVRVVTLNSKIVIYTTIILISFGTLFFFFTEYENTLAEHTSLFGKLTTAFFGAVTPRTAGFNSVDTSALHISTIMIVLLLMWIGASPASTGGGIKTSTFAIATLNIFSIARGKNRITLARRVISDYSVRKTSAIVSMSLIFVGLGVFFISAIEPEGRRDLLPIAFECFSAYSTVGLSIGNTGQLTDASKIVLVMLMFIGRVGAINLLIGMLRRLDTSHMHYPEEDILIN